MPNIISSSTVPAFVATLSGTLNNVTGDATIYPCVFNTLTQGSSLWFNTSTGVSTAIQAGKYNYGVFIDFGNIASQTVCVLSLVTSAKTYILSKFSPSAIKGPASACMIQGSLTAIPMTLNDTAYITLQVSGGSKTISFGLVSYFTGRRVS